MMLPIWGVAQSVIREASRSKLFLILIFFAVVVLGVIPLFPAVGAEDKAKFLSTWSLSAAYFIGALSLLFLVAPAVPRELEEKNLQQVLVKPVGKLSFMLGRLLGYALITLGIFLGMALLSYSVVLVDSSLRQTKLQNPGVLVEPAKYEVDGFRVNSKDPTITHWLYDGGKLIYHFDDLSKLDIDRENAKIWVGIPVSYAGDYKSFGGVTLLVESPANDKKFTTEALLTQEEHLVDIPAELWGGPFTITVKGESGKLGLGDRKWPESRGVRILVPNRGSPFWNWLNAFILKALAIILIAACSLAISTLISGKLALALSIVLFFAGSSTDYFFVTGRMLRGEIESPEIAHQKEHGHESEEAGHKKNGPPGVGFSILGEVADGFATVLPDLDRFDVSKELTSGYNVSIRRNFELFLYLVIYLVVFLLIGVFGLKFREMG